MAKIEYCIAKTNEMVSVDSTFLLLPFAIAAGRFIFAAQFSERSVRLGVRTPDFHSGNTGSIPVRTTKASDLNKLEAFFFTAHLYNLLN
jgi:hypothetical protein